VPAIRVIAPLRGHTSREAPACPTCHFLPPATLDWDPSQFQLICKSYEEPLWLHSPVHKLVRVSWRDGICAWRQGNQPGRSMVPQRACPSFAVSEMAIGAHPECRRSETVTLREALRKRAVQGAGAAKRGGDPSASYRVWTEWYV